MSRAHSCDCGRMISNKGGTMLGVKIKIRLKIINKIVIVQCMYLQEEKELA